MLLEKVNRCRHVDLVTAWKTILFQVIGATCCVVDRLEVGIGHFGIGLNKGMVLRADLNETGAWCDQARDV